VCLVAATNRDLAQISTTAAAGYPRSCGYVCKTCMGRATHSADGRMEPRRARAPAVCAKVACARKPILLPGRHLVNWLHGRRAADPFERASEAGLANVSHRIGQNHEIDRCRATNATNRQMCRIPLGKTAKSAVSVRHMRRIQATFVACVARDSAKCQSGRCVGDACDKSAGPGRPWHLARRVLWPRGSISSLSSDFFETSRSRRHPRLYTNRANLASPTTHVAVVHELTSNSKFAKRAIYFANWRSLQSGPAVTTLLGISRAPTSNELNRSAVVFQLTSLPDPACVLFLGGV